VPPIKQEKLPDLEVSLLLAKMKQRHLEDAAEGLDRPDPIKPVNQVKIQEAVQKFVTQIELTKDPLTYTYKVYEQNLREYSEWTKLTYVDQIDKDHLFAYRKHITTKAAASRGIAFCALPPLTSAISIGRRSCNTSSPPPMIRSV
jgi:hypothetical protein